MQHGRVLGGGEGHLLISKDCKDNGVDVEKVG
jgi:hypothetical protein